MRTNTTKAKLAEGKVVFGAIISRHAPDLIELFGRMATGGWPQADAPTTTASEHRGTNQPAGSTLSCW